MEFLNFNGRLLKKENVGLAPDDHSYRYGDGIFETMKMQNGRIALIEFHFDRLFTGIEQLGFSVPAFFSREKIHTEVKQLCEKNNCSQSCRIRLSVSAGSGGLYDLKAPMQYLIECSAIKQEEEAANANGLVIGVFADAKKPCDAFSHLKSASAIHYAAAARFAKGKAWNDALLLNTYERVCESTIANIFWVKNGAVFTPPLSEGCVNGVMRRFCLEKLSPGWDIAEKKLSMEELKEADEIFLTNAVRCLRWVGDFEGKNYADIISKKIRQYLIRELSVFNV
jgi:branched-chain amino acid aminotransferase